MTSSYYVPAEGVWWDMYGGDALPVGEENKPLSKCECGGTVTYGENIPGYMHIDYCPLYKNDKENPR